MSTPAWPALPLEEWKDTYETLHLWTQVVGKARLALSPHLNHWWEAPFYVTARGLTTSPMPYAEGLVQADFDFLSHELALLTSGGRRRRIALRAMAVADFYALFMESLRALGVSVKIWPVSVETPAPVRLDRDRRHATYDPEQANRFWRVLAILDPIFKEFRARFIGKDSPVHFFWGSFDFAVSRFSGRRAPPRPGADRVSREAYSHEVISAGWWPGGAHVDGPAFYSYAAPEPPGFARSSLRPPRAYYDPVLREFLLKYDDVRASTDPRKEVLEFLQSAYEAGASGGRWDRAELEFARAS